MPTFQLLLLLSIILVPTFSYSQVKYAPITEQDVDIYRYTKKRNTGIILTSVGSTAIAGGVILAATAEWKYTKTGNNVNYTSKDGKAVVGILAVLAGIPMTIVGIVKTVKGKKKLRQTIEKYALIMDYSPHGTTLGLAYKF